MQYRNENKSNWEEGRNGSSNITSNISASVTELFCQSHAQHLDVAVQTFQHVLLHVIQPTVIVLGVVGNVLNLLILLSRIQLRGRSTNSAMVLLFWMSVNDLIVLTIQLPSFGYYENAYYKCLFRYPMSNWCLTAIAILSATVAVDRFAAIKRVAWLQRFFTRHARKVVYLILAFSGAFNVPRCFDFEILLCSSGYLGCRPTNFSAHWRLNLIAGFVNSIVPMFVMLTFGSIVIYSFVRIRNEHKKLFSTSKFSSKDFSSSSSRISLASRMVVASITLFAMCTATSVLFIMLDLANFNPRLTNWGSVLLFLNNFLTLAKSSVNFIIYCSTCSMYRAAVKQLLCGKCKRQEQDCDNEETSPVNMRELRKSQWTQHESIATSAFQDGKLTDDT